MASAAAPRHGRAPDLPRVRPVIASPDPEPDGLVSVGSLLRREGRRAAHAVDRPLVPRARDLLEAGTRTSTHRAAVAAGALLAVTTVLGSNALGDGAIISGVGVDEAADAGPAAVPPPAEPLPLAAADAPVSQVMAALQSAGTPLRAALLDGPIDTGLPESAAVSGAGIVAAALGAPAVDQGDGTTRSGSSSSGDERSTDNRSTDDRSAVSRSDDTRRDSSRDASRDSDRDDRGSRADDGTPSRSVVPLPTANPDLPPPVTGSDIVDGSLGGPDSAQDGTIRRGVVRTDDSGSDGDTAGDADSPPSADDEDGGGTTTPADGEEQDAGGDDSSAAGTSSDDTASDADTSSDGSSSDGSSSDGSSSEGGSSNDDTASDSDTS